MNSQQGFGIIGIIVLVAVFGTVAFSGWYVWDRNQSDNKTNTNQSTTGDASTTTENVERIEQTDQEPTETYTIFEPVESDVFGEFGNTQNKPTAKYPNDPTVLDDKVDKDSYQGIVYINEDGSYRVLIGTLSGVEPGIFKIADAFELRGLDAGTPQISLAVAEPPTFELKSTKVAYWANLDETNQMVTAVMQYKESQQ